MKTAYLLLLAALIASVEAKPKVAILNIQNAILHTADGKAAAAEMHRKFDAEQARLGAEEKEIARMRVELPTTGDPTLFTRLKALELSHQRKMDDSRSRVEAEQRRLMNDLTAKFMVVVDKYAKQKHFEVVLDESDPKTPVLWRADHTDITAEVIKIYEQGGNKR